MPRSYHSTGAATGGVAVTPHASNPINAKGVCRGIMCAADGTATVRFVEDSADVQIYMLAGVVYPFNLSHVRASGTSATGIVALY